MRMLTGPLIMIASALLFYGGAAFLNTRPQGGLIGFWADLFGLGGALAGFVVFLVGLRLTLIDRQRRD